MSDAVEHVISVLLGAERMGAPTDDPEGSMYIQLSDTFAKYLAKELQTYLEDMWSDAIDRMGPDA